MAGETLRLKRARARPPAACGWALACACLLAVGTAGASPPPPTEDARAAREIAGLIDALGRSDCRFERNGRWYDAARARTHLQRKYDWARRRGLAGTAEQFIERAASRSSVSGRAYRVRCAGRPDTDAQAWFREALGRLRARGV